MLSSVLIATSRGCRRVRSRFLVAPIECSNKLGQRLMCRNEAIQGANHVQLRGFSCISIDSSISMSPNDNVIDSEHRRLYYTRSFHIEQSQTHRRLFHSTSIRKDDENEKELSPKERKKLLKQKAKAAAAAAAEAEGEDEDPAEARKKALQAKLKAKKESEESEDSATTTEDKAEDVASSEEAAGETIGDTSTDAGPAPPETTEPVAAPPADTSSVEATTAPNDEPKQYSYPELTEDAARHKAGMDDPSRPQWQNPLHHDNPDLAKTYREDFDSDEAFEAAKIAAPPLSTSSDDVAAPAHIHELAEEILHLNMLEMNELVNKIADHYGFHEGMLSPDDVAGGGGDDLGAGDGDEAAAAPAAEKTSFDIKLVSFDAKAKIKVIKEVRSVAGLGLKEAKEMVEGAPTLIVKQMKKEEAEELKGKLEELGAVVEIV